MPGKSGNLTGVLEIASEKDYCDLALENPFKFFTSGNGKVKQNSI